MTQPPPISLRLTEAQFQQVVMDYAMLMRWHAVHFRPAKVGDRWVTAVQGMKGSPDLLLARDQRVLMVELKSMKGRVAPEQTRWLTAIGPKIGKLWTPAEWNDGTIYRELRAA